MPQQTTAYKIFIASPEGLEAERRSFRETIIDHNESDAMHHDLHFVPVGWEDTLGGIGRPQSIINDEVRKCDYLVLVLHNRWGSPTAKSAEDGHTSGTEEELYVAQECYKAADKPMRQIVIFFKGVDTEQLADPGLQLKKVLDFRKKLEDEKDFLFRTFDTPKEFEKLLRRYLAQWVRDAEDGQTDKVIPPKPLPTAPETAIKDGGIQPSHQEDEKLSDESSPEIQKMLAKAEQLANEGKLTDAEALYARTVVGRRDPNAFNRYGHFLLRVGRLAQAEDMYKGVLDAAKLKDDDELRAIAYGNLGNIYQTRGELDRAEEMRSISLEIFARLGRQEGMASQYGNLGTIYHIRGELDKAEEMHGKSLEIEERLGQQEGMAIQYGNLSNIYRTRGELDKAEQMLLKSLEIFERLGRQERMAATYGNLGLIYRTRGKLDKAEEMFRKSLEISKHLGCLELMAGDYGNLGIIYQNHDDLDRAEQMHRKSLEIFNRLGQQEGMAVQYGNLGIIYGIRKELEKAEKMFFKSLEINERLGRQEGMATTYGNLGKIYQTRGDLDKAAEMHLKALEIGERLGRQEGMAIQYGNLGNIYKQRGQTDKVHELWTKARDIYAKIGIVHMADEVQGWLDELPGDDG